MAVKISVSVPLYPTEDRDKVEKCVENLFDQRILLKEKQKEKFVVLYNENIGLSLLRRIYNNVRMSQVLDTARKCAVLEDEQTLLLYLHKQALFVDKIAIITKDASSPLGNVELRIRGKQANELLNWLIPKTFQGEIMTKREYNEIYSL